MVAIKFLLLPSKKLTLLFLKKINFNLYNNNFLYNFKQNSEFVIIYIEVKYIIVNDWAFFCIIAS